MLEKKSPQYPGLPWMPRFGNWSTDPDKGYLLNDLIHDFVIYDNATDHHNPDPADYMVAYDIMGPQWVLPSQCIKRTSFLIPKKTSPIIAFIGNSTDWGDNGLEEIFERLVSYW